MDLALHCQSLVAQFGKRLADLDRGAEHEDVGRERLPIEFGVHPADGVRLGEIGDERCRLSAAAKATGDRIGLFVAIVDDDMRARAGQGRRDGEADPARRAGNQRDASRKCARHQPSSGFTRAVASSIACCAGLRPSTAACVSSMKMS